MKTGGGNQRRVSLCHQLHHLNASFVFEESVRMSEQQRGSGCEREELAWDWQSARPYLELSLNARRRKLFPEGVSRGGDHGLYVGQSLHLLRHSYCRRVIVDILHSEIRVGT